MARLNRPRLLGWLSGTVMLSVLLGWALYSGARQMGYEWQWPRVLPFLGEWDEGTFYAGPLLNGLLVTLQVALLSLLGTLAVGVCVVSLRLRAGVDDGPLPSARVMWCRPVPAEPGSHAAGLAWEGEPPLRTRLLLEQVALFDLELADDGAALVCMHGDFTEMTRFDALAARLVGVGTISFDLAAVRYISSAGVRAWCELLGQVAGARLSFRHCSTAFISQAAMVPLVLAGGTVRSFAAPYYCEACGFDDERLLEVGAIAKDGDRLVAPQLACARCGAPSDLDDLPDRYFAFLAM